MILSKTQRRASRILWTLTLIFGTSCLAPANDEIRQRIQVTNTQHMDLPAGGTVRLKNSTGELTIEAWDQPGVEIATVKSTKAEYTSAERERASHELDRVKIAAERKGDELVITTNFPRGWPPVSPLGSATNFYLDTHIKVPRDVKLVVDHNIGEIHVDGVTGDIRATTRQGLITLRLPAEGQYAIDAKSNLGSVTSDFPGTTEGRFLFGHQFVESSQALHKLYLRSKFGDIVIWKLWKPSAASAASK